MSNEQSIINKANSLANVASFSIADLTPAQLTIIKNTIAKGATDDELQWFLYQSHALGLNPLLKEIWFIKRAKKTKQPNGQWDYARLPNGEIDYSNADLVIMTSNDGYMKKAAENPEFLGIQSMEVRENDEFEMEFEDGEFRVKKHKFSHKDRGAVIGAWACVTYQNNSKDWNYASMEEYCQYFADKSGKKVATGVWANNPSAMIKKCAMTPLLKKAGKLSGIYTEEEMSRASESSVDVQVVDNSPTKASVREDAINLILEKFSKAKSSEEFMALTKDVAANVGGFLKEEIEKIKKAAMDAKKRINDQQVQETARRLDKFPEDVSKEEVEAHFTPVDSRQTQIQ